MATDADVRRLLGQPFPSRLAPPWRCDCGGLWRAVAPWHPGGQAGALVLAQCDRCHSTRNGGAL